MSLSPVDIHTSLERTFHYEIIFNKICGGFMFSGLNWWASALYGAAVIALSRVINIKYTYTVFQNFNEPQSRGSEQNFKLFWSAYYLVANATVVVNFLTGIKYHDLLLVILRKRFDSKYLSGSPARDSPAAAAANSSIPSSSTLSTNTIINAPYPDRVATDRQQGDKQMSGAVHGIQERVRTVRYLFATYLALTTLSYCLNRRAHVNHQAGNQSSWQVAATNSPSALTLLNSLNGSQVIVQTIDLSMARTIVRCITEIALAVVAFFLDFVQAALTLSQTYGLSFFVLMVTATLTDMISYSRVAEGFVYVERRPEASNQGSAKLYPRRKPTLTTQVLVQARDVLIALRCSMSFAYLMILILNLTQLIGVFLLFNEAVSNDRFEALALIIVDYFLVAFSMYLSRYGYHWLHSEVRRFKRVIDERHLFLNGREEDLRLSNSERITACRLAEDIEGLWPTDWYKPDLKSYLKQNILVVTLVATLQQLVDASSRIEYNKQN